MQFYFTTIFSVFIASAVVNAASVPMDKRVDIPGLKCGGLDALSKFTSSIDAQDTSNNHPRVRRLP